jgi:hypothetical protein
MFVKEQTVDFQKEFISNWLLLVNKFNLQHVLICKQFDVNQRASQLAKKNKKNLQMYGAVFFLILILLETL